MTNQHTDEMREAFERADGGYFSMRRTPSGLYALEETRYRYNIWCEAFQAATASAEAKFLPMNEDEAVEIMVRAMIDDSKKPDSCWATLARESYRALAEAAQVFGEKK